MSVGFLAPQFLWALLALPLIALLHFIRTRRRSSVVSALFLWRQAREASEDRRRVAPTWLLLLQLLFATLAALALARPLVSFQGPPDRVLVIDATASMAARDADGVRIDKARSLASDLIAGAGSAAVIRAGADATVAAPLTADRSLLRQALGSLRPADRGGDLSRAVELAEALSPEGEVHVISDSPAPAGGEATYHSVAGQGVNHGITTFDTAVGQAYVAVSTNDRRPQELTLTLSRGDAELARTTLLVPAAGQAGVTFPVGAADGFLEARLHVPESDALSLDDVAYVGQRRLLVAMEESSPPVARALEALADLDYIVTGQAAPQRADVQVLFGADPEELPETNVLLFSDAAEEPVYRSIRDWEQGNELLRFVDLREVVVGVAEDLANEELPGWETLVRASDLSPILSRKRENDHLLVRAAFHPSQTDLVLRPAFPALMANIMNGFRGSTSVALGAALPAGATLAGEAVAVALEPAIYSTPAGPVAASLLSRGESVLAAPDSGEPMDDAGSVALDASNETSRSVALWLLTAAGALLLLEWLLWSRGSTGWLRGR